MKPLHNDDANPVSAEMTAALGLMIRRVRRLILLRGLSLVILAWLAGLAVAMAIDGYWVIYSPWARWGVALIAYGPAAVVMVWTLLRPLSQTLTTAGLARAIERRHPELHERVSSAVELMATINAPDQRGSAALIHALADRAAQDIRHVDPRVEISMRKVARYLAMSAAALLLVVAAGVLWPTTVGRLALRSALPILNLPNIHAGDLTVEPGDSVTLQGERMRIVLRSTRAGLPDAQVIVETPDNRRQVLSMSRLADRDGDGSRFSAVTEPVTEGFVYRIRTGGAVTRAYQVAVTPRPLVTHLDVTYEYPSYTEREPTRTRVVQGDIRAVAGTQVTIRAAFNKPIETVSFHLDGKPVSSEGDQAVALRQSDPDVVMFRLQLEGGMHSTWRLEGVDQHGFTGGTGEYTVQAVADAAPNVVITQPVEEQLKLRASDRLMLHYSIDDDFGVDLAGLILEVDGRPLPIQVLPLSGATTAANRTITGHVALNLSDLPLQQTRRLALQVRARDSRSAPLGGPQVGTSRILQIDLDGNVKPYQEQVLDQHTKRLREALAAARGEITQAKGSLTTLDQAIKRPADAKTVQDNTRHALTAVEKIEHALETVDLAMRDGFYDGLRQPLRATAGTAVVNAAESLAQVPVAENRESQTKMAETANTELTRADAALESLAGRLDEMHRAIEQAVRTRELAQRQAELAASLDPVRREGAATASVADPEMVKALDAKPTIEPDAATVAVLTTDDSAHDEMLAKLRLQQAHLVDDLAAVIQQMPEANKVAVAQTREQIERLKEETQALREKQRELAARSEEAKRMADQWKTASEGMEEQLRTLSDARREMLLPRPSVPLGEIAADLEAGRLRDAAAKIDTVAGDMERQLERLDREQKTEALAEQVRGLLAENAAPLKKMDPPATESAVPALAAEDRKALEAMARRLDEIAEASKQATPLARQALALHSPAKELRAVAGAEAGDGAAARPETAEAVRDKAARLEAAMEAATRTAQAERLAERIESVADEVKTMEDLLQRARELSRRMADTVEPWRETLDSTAAQVAQRAQAARQRQETLAAEAQAMAQEARQNPVAAVVPVDSVRQALMPQPERLTKETPPSPAVEAHRTETAAVQARRAAEAIEASMEQTQDRADGEVQRAREALNAVTDASDPEMQREARWRLEEAEEARERDRQRVEEAAATAQRLKRLADVLDEVAQEHRQVDAQLAEIADDTQRVAEAEALSRQSGQRAQAAQQEKQRLERVQDQLQQQQQQMLAEMGETPATDARGLAQWEKEKALPSASESMLELAASAADLARRQEELTGEIEALRATQEQLRRQASELRQPVSSDAPSAAPATTAPSEASPPATAETERRIHEALEATEEQMARLGEAQRQIGQETRQLKEQAAALTSDARPSPMPQPEQQMDRAARALESAATPEAVAAAQQAARQQAALAEALAQRAAMMPPDERLAAATPPSSPTPPSPASPASPSSHQQASPPSTPQQTPPSPPSPSSPSSPQQASPPSTPPQKPQQASPSSPQSPPSGQSPQPPSSPTDPQPPGAAPQQPGSEFPDMALPPAQQAMLENKATKPEFTGEKLVPETEVIPNIGVDKDGVEWNLGHAHKRPDSKLPENFDLGKPPVLDDPRMPFNYAGSPDVPVPPVPPAPKKEAMTGPVPYSDPVTMAAPVTELPKIIVPDRFPQTFAGEFSDAPIPPPPPEKSSSLAPAPRLTKSDLDAAKKEFAELSAIHIDDAPNSSDMGGQATEELPSEMLFEPGAQYSRGAPGQSSMPGMELGQLAQAENQDQQSPSPAQTPMPSGGGGGGGESQESPPPSQSSPSQSPPQGSPPSPPSGGSSSGSSSGSQSGQPPQSPASPSQSQQQSSPPPPTSGQQASSGQSSAMQSGSMQGTGPADPSAPGAQASQGPPSPPPPMDAATEAQRLREIQGSLGSQPQQLAAESLPDHGMWRDAGSGEGIPAASVRQLADQLQQLNRLTPRLLERAQGPPSTSQGLGSIGDESVEHLLPRLATQAQALSQAYSGRVVEFDAAAMPADQLAIAEALQYASRAALTGDPREAEAAAARMARTAREAQLRVEAMGLQLEPRQTPRAGDDLSDAELRRLGLPVSDWLRLPGELRSEVLQARPAEGPEEYRILIQRYFSDIARDQDEDGE